MHSFKKKLLVIVLFFCTTQVNAVEPFEVNKNFKNRFEYVTSFFDYIIQYDEDFLLSLNVVDTNSKRFEHLVIGIKELFKVLHHESFDTKDQLYYSVGKIFQRDTLCLEEAEFSKFKNYMVNKDSLEYLNSLDYDGVVSKYLEEGLIKNTGSELERVIIFYFDRRFYPTRDPGNYGNLVKLDYNFESSNNNTIFRKGRGYLQVWDKNGILISELPE